MTMTAGVEVMVPVAGEENMIPVVDATTTSTATEMAVIDMVVGVIDMGDTAIGGAGTIIEVVEIGTGDMMDATMLDLAIIIITTTARADILTTVGVKKEGAGGETSRGGNDGVGPENGEKGGDGAVRVPEATIAAANAGIVVVGAGADHGADHGADRAVHRRAGAEAEAEAGVEVWTVLIVRFVLPRINPRRVVAGAVRAPNHDPDRVHRTVQVGADLGAIAEAEVVPEQVAARFEAGKVTIVHCHLLASTYISKCGTIILI